MVKKLVTGLALSLGAGLALTVTARAGKKKGGWRPASSEGSLTPVTIRVHSATPRNEQTCTDLALMRSADYTDTVTIAPLEREISPQTSAELAEIRMMIEALETRGTEMMSTVNHRIDDLQNHLPRFIDVKVTARIREVEERLRTEFQDESSRTLDSFLKTLDSKVLPRIAMVEEAIGSQGEEIGHMRQRIEKTDETLERVLDRIEKVVDAMSDSYINMPNNHVLEISQKAVA